MTDSLPMPDGTAQQLDRVYEEQTPMLLAAVSSLVKRGYELHPAEGLELIHDFYVEALPGILGRYDPAKAKFSTYLYAAFLRFARPRLLRNMRWRRMFVSFDDAIAHPVDEQSFGDSEAVVARVSKALEVLPRDLRTVVDGRTRRGESERQLAKRLRLSRYVVRQRLAEALGRIAIFIGEDERIPAELRPLAVRLWREGQPLMSVAAELGISRQEAHERLRRLIRSLGAAAGSLHD